MLTALADFLGAVLPDFVRVPVLTFVLPHVMYWCVLAALPLLIIAVIWWERNRNTATAVPRWVTILVHVALAVVLGPLIGSVLVYGVAPVQNPLAVPLGAAFAPEVWLLGAAVGVVLAQLMLWGFRRAITRRDAGEREGRVSLAVAYLLWLGGGFLGLHRYYLRAVWPCLAYSLFFVLLIVGNLESQDARELQSEARDDRIAAEFDANHFRTQVEQGRENLRPQLEEAEARLAEARRTLEAATARRTGWDALAGFFGWLIGAMLLVDAVLIPRLVRRCNAMETHLPPPSEVKVIERETTPSERRLIQTPTIRVIERANGWVGEFIAYWAVLAVAVYYYEVLARYVFNSPTNWAHEGMFLMFGMQYLLSGGYALRENAHVRVDVVYERFSERTKAVIDLVTSVFFFIFTVTLFVTGALFAIDALAVGEVSFNEWAIQYWPVKLALPVGALLIVAQGAAGVVKDVIYLDRTGGPTTRRTLDRIGLIGAPVAALVLLWSALPFLVPYDWVAWTATPIGEVRGAPLWALFTDDTLGLRSWFWGLVWLVLVVGSIALAMRAVRRLPRRTAGA